MIPRHPTQLYEALAYLAIFIFLILYYRKHTSQIKNGLLLGFFLVLIFGFRFFVEFYKENQVAFENGLALNMGQFLSIPAVLAGIYLIVHRPSKK